jgi:hypothetical protein
MHLSETRLGDVLNHEDRAAQVADGSPVAALVVESLAAIHPEHAEAVRDAAWFLCALLDSHDQNGTAALRAPIATHTFSAERHTSAETMQRHLAQLPERDLLLGVAAQALLRRPVDEPTRQRSQAEHDAVRHALYLLLRMFETQEDSEALERAVHEGAPLPMSANPPSRL